MTLVPMWCSLRTCDPDGRVLDECESEWIGAEAASVDQDGVDGDGEIGETTGDDDADEP